MKTILLFAIISLAANCYAQKVTYKDLLGTWQTDTIQNHYCVLVFKDSAKLIFRRVSVDPKDIFSGIEEEGSYDILDSNKISFGKKCTITFIDRNTLKFIREVNSHEFNYEYYILKKKE